MVAVAGLGATVAFGVLGSPSLDTIVLPLVAAAYVGLGLLMVVRQPGNSVAWLLFIVGTWIVSQGTVELLTGNQSIPPDPVAWWDLVAIVFLETSYLFGMMFPLFIFFYIFPTGRFLSRRWSWAGWVVGLLAAITFVTGGLVTEIGPEGRGWVAENPIGLLDRSGGAIAMLDWVFGIGFIGLAIGGILAIIVRYRRADTLVRTQIKWVVYALLIVAGILLAGALGPVLPVWAGTVQFVIIVSAIPVSVTVAISRYQLYEIDRIFSRTVAYLLVVAVLGLVYLIGAVWLPTQLLGEQSPVFVAGSTLAAAALFNPTRKRILSWIDRRFYRSRYDAELVIDDFTQQLRNATDVDQLAEDVVAVLVKTFQPSSIGAWIRSDPDL